MNDTVTISKIQAAVNQEVIGIGLYIEYVHPFYVYPLSLEPIKRNQGKDENGELDVYHAIAQVCSQVALFGKSSVPSSFQ